MSDRTFRVTNNPNGNGGRVITQQPFESQTPLELALRYLVVYGTQALIAVVVWSLGLVYPAYLIWLPGEGTARHLWLTSFVIGGVLYAAVSAFVAYKRYRLENEIDAKLNLAEGDSPQDPRGLARIVDTLTTVWENLKQVRVKHLSMIKYRPDTDVRQLIEKLGIALGIAERLQEGRADETARSVDINTFESTYRELKSVLKNAGDSNLPLGSNIWYIKYYYHRFLAQCLSAQVAISGIFALAMWLGWLRYYPTY